MYIYIYIYKCDFGLSVYPINFIMAYLMYIRCKLVPPTSNALGVDSDAVPITARVEALGQSGG